MFETILIVEIVLLVFALIILLVYNKKYRKAPYIKAANKLVEEGTITQEQADAFIWLLFEYKPNKRKKK